MGIPKNFEGARSFDPQIRAAMMDEKGRPPDNFIEDSQGGGVDPILWGRETPEAEQMLVDGLKLQLSARHPEAQVN